VRPSLVLCTRFPTLATVLVTARHVAPATCTPRDEQTRFSERNKDERKIKQNYPGFKFKPRQVNDSSQSNQGTGHLVSHWVCAPCRHGNMIVASHSLVNIVMTERHGQLHHMDTIGHSQVRSMEGKWYVLVIVDDYSCYS
jgi:hypothetical protein